MTSARGFLLAIGSALTETSTSKLTTSGTRYLVKSLNSKPDNWRVIARLLYDPNLIGVIVKFTGKDYERLTRAAYGEVAEALVERIRKVPNLVLVHEAVAGLQTLLPELEQGPADDDFYENGDYDDGSWNDRVARDYFGEVEAEVRNRVHAMFERHGVTITTFKKNAEMSILAATFIDDVQSNLLFRLYVPKGRIYEDELARLLEMFHEWLGSVKSHTVRQTGYRTPSGRVIEFYSDDPSRSTEWKTDLAEFSNFLSLVDDPAAARSMLLTLGVEVNRADDLVGRYARDARRVLLDSRHQRDRYVLDIQQRLEAELTEEGLEVPAGELEALVRRLVPTTSLAVALSTTLPVQRLQASPSSPLIVINQQFIEHAAGVVAQTISGGVSLGTPLDEILKLIRQVGGDGSDGLEIAARELADVGAPAANRITARQKLRAFLIRNGQRVETAAFATAWKWLESQMGGN